MTQIWSSEIKEDEISVTSLFYRDADEAMQMACEVKWDEYEELKEKANHSFSHNILAFIGGKEKAIGKNLADCFNFEPESYEATWEISDEGDLSSKQEGMKDIIITYRVLKKGEAAKGIRSKEDFLRKTEPIGSVAAELLL